MVGNPVDKKCDNDFKKNIMKLYPSRNSVKYLIKENSILEGKILPFSIKRKGWTTDNLLK